METAVIYCRKSDPNATTADESFENQEDTCRTYAREHGYSVLKVYREAHSGADLAGRAQVWEAMDDVRRGDAQVLLVRNFDRLARKPEHQGVILYEVEEKYGGRVEAALEQIDRDDVTSRMTRGILAVVAEAERLNAVSRMERGKRRRAERGHLPGMANALFGYRWLDDEPGKRTVYVVDEETGPIVQRVYRLVVSGHGLRAIARLFNSEGVLTPSQFHAQNGHIGRRIVGASWTAEQVRRIVSDRTYTGEGAAYRWTRVRSKNGTKLLAARTPDDAKRVRLTVPALVDLDTWNVAQRAVQAKEKTGRPPHDQDATWLRLHVYCGVCGKRMHVKHTSDGKSYEYECINRKSGNMDGKPCEGGNFSIRAHLLDAPVYERLAGMVGLPDPMPLRAQMVKKLGTDKMQALASMADGYAAQLQEKRALLDTARRRAMQTSDDELAQQFLRDAETLNAEIHSLEQEYADAREELDDFNTGNAWIDATLARIRAALPHDDIKPTPDDIRALSYEDRRHLLAVTGLYVAVYPVGWHHSGKRVEVEHHWAIDPVKKAWVARSANAEVARAAANNSSQPRSGS